MTLLDEAAAVRRYLAPPVSAPWRWDDGGEVIAWLDGQTIAFRAEMAEVLTRLARHGLPPFSAVLLLLAACRDGWRGESNQLSTMASLVTTLTRGEFPDWLGGRCENRSAVAARRPPAVIARGSRGSADRRYLGRQQSRSAGPVVAE